MGKVNRLNRYNETAAFAVCEWSSMGVPDASDSRLAALTRWVVDDLGFSGSRIEPASADASFRRYFRVTRGADTCIVMDAPPDKENVAPFVSIAQALAGMNLNVPLVLARDVPQGLLLLSDLGSRQYLDELDGGPGGRPAVRRCARGIGDDADRRRRGGTRAPGLRSGVAPA